MNFDLQTFEANQQVRGAIHGCDTDSMARVEAFRRSGKIPTGSSLQRIVKFATRGGIRDLRSAQGFVAVEVGIRPVVLWIEGQKLERLGFEQGFCH